MHVVARAGLRIQGDRVAYLVVGTTSLPERSLHDQYAELGQVYRAIRIEYSCVCVAQPAGGIRVALENG